jgi:formylglycine-generating enzyme required for sulfatase activity
MSSFRECAKDCPEMVLVPPGFFIMGSPETEKDRGSDEGPLHKVTIADRFAVAKFPITFDEWDACAGVGGCPQLSDRGWGRGRQPAINLNWEDALQYVAWLSRMTGKTYRLLSETEWEYAARAGTTTVYFWGDEVGSGNANCIHCGSQWDGKQPSPVGRADGCSVRILRGYSLIQVDKRRSCDVSTSAGVGRSGIGHSTRLISTDQW